jgi:hypothetical protein
MCYSENTACDSCDAVGLCIIIGDSVLCADCNKNREELETEFADDACIHIDEIDNNSAWDDFADSEYDSTDMYGRDDDNDIAMGAYDE